MSHGMYELVALLPKSSDFAVELAIQHFASLKFSMCRSGRFVYKDDLVRAEPAIAQGDSKPSGFRVFYGDWAIVAWLDESEGVLADSQELAKDRDLPAPADVIAECSRRLTVWSDVDEPDFDHSDLMTDFTDELRQRFGAFIHDPVDCGWWT